jgi:hypothetical protein
MGYLRIGKTDVIGKKDDGDSPPESIAVVLKAWLALASGIGTVALVNLTTIFGNSSMRSLALFIGAMLILCGGCSLM